MESRLNDMRLFGMPVQFVAVVAISLALTIYFGAWAADARIDARGSPASAQNVQQFDFRTNTGSSVGTGLSGGIGQGAAGGALQNGNAAEGQAWERFFLVACPLH